MAKPPEGVVTGAVPAGGGGQGEAPNVWTENNPAGIATAIASLQMVWRRVLGFIFFVLLFSSTAHVEVPTL
jgi:hypothetical protein